VNFFTWLERELFWYRLYRTWWFVPLGIGLFMAAGWVFAAGNLLTYSKLDVAHVGEIHKFDGHEGYNDGQAVRSRACTAFYDPTSRDLHVRNDQADSLAILGPAPAAIGSDASFCRRIMSGVPNWRIYQYSYVQPWSSYVVEALLIAVTSLAGLILVAMLVGSIAFISTARSFQSIVLSGTLLVLAAWYLATLWIFASANFDTRRLRWNTSEGFVDVRLVYVLKDGSVRERPNHLYEWAEPGFISDSSTEPNSKVWPDEN
jgi:hypothetical protein